MKAEDGDKSDIFARTSVANHKLRIADDVSNTDAVEDAFGSSHISVASSGTKFRSETNLGDNLNVRK